MSRAIRKVLMLRDLTPWNTVEANAGAIITDKEGAIQPKNSWFDAPSFYGSQIVAHFIEKDYLLDITDLPEPTQNQLDAAGYELDDGVQPRMWAKGDTVWSYHGAEAVDMASSTPNYPRYNMHAYRYVVRKKQPEPQDITDTDRLEWVARHLDDMDTAIRDVRDRLLVPVGMHDNYAVDRSAIDKHILAERAAK